MPDPYPAPISNTSKWNRSGGNRAIECGLKCDHVWYALWATVESRENRNWLEKQSMGGGWRKVSRKPTARSKTTPRVGTLLSSSRVTKLARLAGGKTAGFRNCRNAATFSNVGSHWRIHARTEPPHSQCEISPR